MLSWGHIRSFLILTPKLMMAQIAYLWANKRKPKADGLMLISRNLKQFWLILCKKIWFVVSRVESGWNTSGMAQLREKLNKRGRFDETLYMVQRLLSTWYEQANKTVHIELIISQLIDLLVLFYNYYCRHLYLLNKRSPCCIRNICAQHNQSVDTGALLV